MKLVDNILFGFIFFIVFLPVDSWSVAQEGIEMEGSLVTIEDEITVELDTLEYVLDFNIPIGKEIPNVDTVISSLDLEKYNGEEFQYLNIQSKSMLGDFKEWMAKWLSKLLKNGDLKWSTQVIEYIIDGILIIALIVLIYFIIKILYHKDGKWVFKKKVNGIMPNVAISEEEYNLNNFDDLIAEFENKQDYKNAIRYYYIWVLKTIIEKYDLTFYPSKTTKMYLEELIDKPVYHDFERITYVYNNVWYGEFLLTELQYQQSVSLFKKMIEQ